MTTTDQQTAAPLLRPITQGPAYREDAEGPGNERPTLSIVVPAFYEEGNLSKLFEEVSRALEPLKLTYEIIFVDDGSKDSTWGSIREIHDVDSRVRGLRFSRNFGHQYALIAGLVHARGDAVISMDADLQHPPEVIPLLIDAWQKGYKIVHTVRKDNDNLPLAKRVTSHLFYKIFSYLSGVDLASGMADFRLLDREVVRELAKFKEGSLFLRGLIEWLGYNSFKVEYTCGDRFAGTSKYSFRRMIKFAWTGITSFSIIPLRIAILVGLFTSMFAFYQLFEAIYIKMFTERAAAGWASTIGIISLLFGILFIFLGIIGEYIGRILVQVQDRPQFIISDRI